MNGNGHETGKALCCVFLLAMSGVNPAQNLAKYERWLCVLIKLTQQKHCDFVNNHKTKRCRIKDLPN